MSLIALKIIALVLSGAICGFFSSSPPGPINLLVADSVLGQRRLHRSTFILGVIIAELILAAIAFWGFQEFFQGPTFQKWAPVIGGAFVIGLGVAGLFSYPAKKGERGKSETHSGRKKGGDLLQGLFLCGSNPAFLVFWIYVMSALSHIGMAQGVPLKSIYLLAGIAIGNTVWFSLYIELLHRGAGRLQGKLLPLLRKGISVALILLGLGGIFISFAP